MNGELAYSARVEYLTQTLKDFKDYFTKIGKDYVFEPNRQWTWDELLYRALHDAMQRVWDSSH